MIIYGIKLYLKKAICSTLFLLFKKLSILSDYSEKFYLFIYLSATLRSV